MGVFHSACHAFQLENFKCNPMVFLALTDAFFLAQSMRMTSWQSANAAMHGSQQKSHLTAHAWYPCVSKESSKRHRGTAPSDSARQPELRFTALPVLQRHLNFASKRKFATVNFAHFWCATSKNPNQLLVQFL